MVGLGELMYCGVKAVIRREDGRILFVKQHTPSLPSIEWYLTLPGGRLDTGEDPYGALKREVFEEVKLRVRIGRPLGMYYFLREDGKQTTLTVFECEAEDISALSTEDNADKAEELHGMEWLTPQEALDKKYPVAHESFNRLLAFLGDGEHSRK